MANVETTGNQTIGGEKTFSDVLRASGGLVANDAIGAAGVGRQDAQIEIRNDNGGHALLAITNVLFPPTTQEEGGVTLQGYTSSGAIVQVGSISAMWPVSVSDATPQPGVLRFNVADTKQGSDIALRLFCNQGAVFFGSSETDRPGARQVQINRASGAASLVGNGDIVIDAAKSGAPAGTVFLNGVNAGDVRLAYGGGRVSIGNTFITEAQLAALLALL